MGLEVCRSVCFFYRGDFVLSTRLKNKAILLISLVVLASTAAGASSELGPLHVRLTVRSTYLSGVGLLVRVEIVDSKGSVERGIWDAVATLSVDNPAVNLSTDTVVLYNGLGTALVKVTGTGDFNLTASVNQMQAGRHLSGLQGQPVTDVSGELAGGTTTWSGIVHVTGDLRVPTDHTLTIQPGTLVLLEGVSSGTGGTDIDVRGTVESLGTAEEPVTFTAFDPDRGWGRINLQDGGPSIFRYTNITVAGRSPGAGHTGAGLVINCDNTHAVFRYCSVTDNYGKIMYSKESDLTFTNCHLARSVMGPEIQSTALLFEDSFITEMFGNDDNDGIYLRGQNSGQKIELRRGVIADGDDDAIDTMGSTVLVEDFIIRDFYDKGVSVNGGGPVTLDHVLIINNGTGVTAKDGNTNANLHVYIDNTTIVSTDTGRDVSDVGIHSYFKYSTSGVIEYFVTNSIIIAAEPVKSDFADPDPLINIDHSNVAMPWVGAGNINAEAYFVDPDNGDYHLRSQAGRADLNLRTWVLDDSTSPCIDAGNMADPIAFEPFPNGGIRNMGAYAGTSQASKSYFAAPPCETIVAGDINGDCNVDFKDFAIMAFHWLESSHP